MLLGSGNFQSPDRASAPRPENQDSSAIRRRHLLQLGLEFAVVVAGQFEQTLFLCRIQHVIVAVVLVTVMILEAVLGLELDVELRRLSEALAVRIPAFPAGAGDNSPRGQDRGANAEPDGSVHQRSLGNFVGEDVFDGSKDLEGLGEEEFHGRED